MVVAGNRPRRGITVETPSQPNTGRESRPASVREAEEAYVVQFGAKRSVIERGTGDATARRRAAILDVLARKANGKPLPEPSGVGKPWNARYFVRRTAWHVLDHAVGFPRGWTDPVIRRG